MTGTELEALVGSNPTCVFIFRNFNQRTENIKMLLNLVKDFAQKNPNFYISFGVDERTGISVSGLNYVLIKSPKTYINVWETAKRDISDGIFECDRITVGSFDLFLEEFDESTDYFIFYDKTTGESYIHNEDNVQVPSVTRILNDFTIIKTAMDKAVKEFSERDRQSGIEYLEGTYPWANFHLRDDDELHVSHPGGFSIYYLHSKVWEYDSYLEKGAVRHFKRILKYK